MTTTGDHMHALKNARSEPDLVDVRQMQVRVMGVGELFIPLIRSPHALYKLYLAF